MSVGSVEVDQPPLSMEVALSWETERDEMIKVNGLSNMPGPWGDTVDRMGVADRWLELSRLENHALYRVQQANAKLDLGTPSSTGFGYSRTLRSTARF